MERPLVFLFGGQGSQYRGMGRSLYDQPGAFRDAMDRLDAIASRSGSRSVVDRLYGPAPSGQSGRVPDDILLTHPAIYMVEVALAQALVAAGVCPDVLVGASLGTFSALAVSGGLEPRAGLSLVLAQASILARSCEPGGMIAILAAARTLESAPWWPHVESAGRHFDGHTVVSAPEPVLPVVEQWLLETGHAYQRLPVRFAFHSRWIDRAREAFLDTAACLPLQAPMIPVIGCATKPGADRASTDAVDIDFLWSAARRPIEFQPTIEALEAQGEHRYVDLTPGGSLATCLRYLLPDGPRRVQWVLSPMGDDRQRWQAVCQAHAAWIPERPPVASSS